MPREANRTGHLRAIATHLSPLACFGVLAISQVGCGGQSGEPAARTVLLVSLDSVRSDFLTFMDAETAPNMSELAERGTIFSSASAPSSWTLPSHTTMFTGAPVQLHGVEWDDVAMDPGHQTLPELLQQNGWFTAGWWTGWFLAGEYGFERGFDVYDNAMTGGRDIEREYRAALAAEDFTLVRTILQSRDIQGHEDITTPNVMKGFEATLNVVKPDQDLFLFTHLFDAHYDYIPEAPFDTKFDPDYSGTMTGESFYKNPAIYNKKASPPRQVSDRDLEHLTSLYRGEIAYIDTYIGKMIDSLERAGRLDNALIVITSDHGDEFFEHGNRGHRQSLNREVLEVPLLIIQPGGQGGLSDALVGLDDILPTIADFAQVSAPLTSLGRSLMPAVAGQTIEDRGQLGSLLHYRLLTNSYVFMDSFRTRESKIIRVLGLDDERVLELNGVVQYDMATDRGETAGNYNRDAIVAGDAWRQFEARLAEVNDAYLGSEPAPRSARGTRVRELFSNNLESLGYMEEGEEAKPGGLGQPWPPGPRPTPKL
ncbi:MAG: arylsulfatase A-like enzyme [Planctomycetota bacterium]|jgi:arylsulfatase A-like enzyme